MVEIMRAWARECCARTNAGQNEAGAERGSRGTERNKRGAECTVRMGHMAPT